MGNYLKQENALHQGGGQWWHDAQAFKLTTDRTRIKRNMLPLSEVMRVGETSAAVRKADVDR